MAKLLIQYSDQPLHEVNLGAFNTLGRHPRQSIQINDRVVSKEHALITLSDDTYWIQDIGSRNGTFVNGEQIVGRISLVHNDLIRLGETSIRFAHEKMSESSVARSRVLFSEDAQNLSAIRSRLDNKKLNHSFHPEHEITDETILREDYEKLRAVFELHEAAGNSIDLDRLLARILEKTFELVHTSRGVILLMNEEGELEPVLPVGYSPNLAQLRHVSLGEERNRCDDSNPGNSPIYSSTMVATTTAVIVLKSYYSR